MAAPCKEEQHRQAARRTCNRARSGLTHPVSEIGGINICVHAAFQSQYSVQLRFLGLRASGREIFIVVMES